MIQAVPGHEFAPADRIASIFSKVAHDAEHWVFDGSWRPAATDGPSSSHAPSAPSTVSDRAVSPALSLVPNPARHSDWAWGRKVSELIEAAFESGSPVFELISENTVAFILPLLTSAPPTALVRYLNPDPKTLVSLVQKAAGVLWCRENELQRQQQTIVEHEDQLMAYAAQVSDDLEELIWLRRLACNLELSESGNHADAIADSVLPSLCQLIQAQAVVYIRDVPLDSEEQDLPAVWQTGRFQIDRQVALQLIAELSVRCKDQPVVINDWYSGHEVTSTRLKQRSAVVSCILLPVATSTARLGWLLAINKDGTSAYSHPRTCGPEYRTYLSETEFGTFEASLMSATAVILAAHGRNCSLFREKELLVKGVIRSMINAIDAKDSYTCGHSDRVAEFSRLIAERMGLPEAECERIHMTGLLHDVGKIGVPDNVLKKPGHLTDAEFELIKQHPVIGYEILKHLRQLSYVLPGVLYHHEAYDGSGYPQGLRGEEIPLAARIIAVADAYDAMTSNRPYRHGMPTETAEQILLEGMDTQWDRRCVQAFFETIDAVRKVSGQQSEIMTPSWVATENGSLSLLSQTGPHGAHCASHEGGLHSENDAAFHSAELDHNM